MLNDVPPVLDHYGWNFYHGGDQALFYSMAQDILANHVHITSAGVGMPLVMAAFIRFLNAVDYNGILPLIAIWNGAFLGLLSVPVMASLALSLSGSRLQAWCAAAIWALLPYALWLGFAFHPQADLLRNAYVPRQLWLTGLSDGPSLFFALSGMMLVAKGVTGSRSVSTGRVGACVLGGVSLGIAAAIRIHTLPVVLVMAVSLMGYRQWRAAAWVVTGALIGLMPQFWQNSVANGHPLNMPYFNSWLLFLSDAFSPGRIRGMVAEEGWTLIGPNNFIAIRTGSAPFSPGHIVSNIVSLVSRRPALVAIAALGGLLMLYSAAHYWMKRGPFHTAAMFGTPLAVFALHAVTFVYADDPVRFTLPAFSLGIPAWVWTGFFSIEAIRRRIRGRRREATK